MKTCGDGEIFEGELAFVQRRDLRGEFEHARAPRDELLADELVRALPAKIGAPGQYGGTRVFFILNLQLHCLDEDLLIGIKLSFETL